MRRLAALSLIAGTALARPVVLVWDDNSSDELGFRVERVLADGAFAEIGVTTAATFADDVPAGIRYTYRVCAYNAHGKSPYSNTVALLVDAAAPTTATITVECP